MLRAHYAASHGLFLDEFGTVWACRGDGLAGIAERVRAVHGQSPLYYFLVRATVLVLGESELTLRLPSIVLGALVPLLGYLGVARSLGNRAGAATLLLLALEPHLVEPSQVARPYPLATALAALALVGLSRALVTGAARDRALAWGSAVACVYAHYVFVPIIPALALAPFVVRPSLRVYRVKALLQDSGVAVAALAPAFMHMIRLLARRSELAWVDEIRWPVFWQLGSPWSLGVLAAATLGLAARATRRGSTPAREPRHGVLAFAALTVLLAVSLILGLWAIGANIAAAQYLSLGVVAAPVVVAWALATLPRPLAALALVLVAATPWAPIRTPEGWREPHPNYGQEWREAAAALDALAPGPADPVLLWPAFIESNLVVDPARFTPELRSFLSSPLDDRPGRPETGRRYFIFTRHWFIPGQGAYFERELVPLLENTSRFFVVTHPDYEALFEKWLARRFQDGFRRTERSREFAGPTVVLRFDRRP